jgi:hypothetical protein
MFDVHEVVVCDAEIDWRTKRKTSKGQNISSGIVSVSSNAVNKKVIDVFLSATVLVCDRSILSKNSLWDL